MPIDLNALWDESQDVAETYRERIRAALENRATKQAAPSSPGGPAWKRKTQQVQQMGQSGLPKEDKPRPANHNQRTVKHYESQGYTVRRVDHFNAFSGRTHDYLGLMDMHAYRAGEPILGIQLTSKANMSARARKALHDRRDSLRMWLESGNRFVILAWHKLPNGRYEATEREITLADI